MPKDAPSSSSSSSSTEDNYPASVTTPLPREELSPKLQKIVDRSDDWMDDLYEGTGPDSTDTSFRYAAYANRLRTIMLSAHRYVAYTSDIGESFRPIAHPILVRSAYAVSWAYLIGDVGHEGYKAYVRNQRLLHPVAAAEQTTSATASGVEGKRLLELKEGQQKDSNATALTTSATPVHIPALETYPAVMAQRAVFQSIASMGLPAFTIHSIVRYSGRALKNASNATLRTWGPIGLGLAAVPALPYMFDKPVEEAVEWTFYNAFKAVEGEDAVGKAHSTGREKKLQKDSKVAQKIKEKEL